MQYRKVNNKANKIALAIKVFAYLAVFVVVNSALIFNIPIGSFYFVILGGITLILLFLFSNEKKIFNKQVLFLLIACLLSIVLNDVPPVFQPYIRLSTLCLVIIMIGPLIFSNNLSNFRFKVFEYLNKWNIFICILSILGFVTGVYKGVTYKPGARQVDFTGFYNHSMILGPMAGIAVLTSMYYLYIENNKKKRILLGLIAFLSFLCCIASASRGALIATIIGSLFFFYKINQGKTGKFISTIFMIVLTLVITFPLWESKATFLTSKIADRRESNDVFDSRTEKWNQRVSEFNSSPVFGIGFASIAVDQKDEFNRETGTIEPGSSWLGVLSMTGLLGFFPMIFLFIKNFRFFFNKKNKGFYNAYLGGLLLLSFVHMIIEGYIFASGAFLCFYVWLLLGVIEGNKRLKKSKI